MAKITEYSIIGNCRSAALVSKVGSIDWCCLPEFHSPAMFSALLDKKDETQDNLFLTVNGHFGSRGRFNNRAIEKDLFFEITKYIPFGYLLLSIVILFIIILIAIAT